MPTTRRGTAGVAVGGASSASAPWPGAGTNSSSAPPASSLAAEPRRARQRRARARRTRPSASLRSRVSTLPRSVDDLEVVARGAQLRAPAQAARAHARARRQGVERRARRRCASRASARARDGRRARARGQLAGTSLAECTARSISPVQQRRSSSRDPARLVAALAAVAAVDRDQLTISPPSSVGHPVAPARAPARSRACPIRISRALLAGAAPRSSRPRASPPSLGAPALDRARTARGRAACARGTRSSPHLLHPERGLVQQPVDHGAGERVDALEVALRGASPTCPRSRPRPAAAIVVGVRAQRGQRRAAPRASPSQAANCWISSSMIPSALRASAWRTVRLRATTAWRSSMSYSAHAVAARAQAASMSRGTARSISSSGRPSRRAHHVCDLLGLEQQVRRGGGGDDDVGALERLGQLVEADAGAAVAAGQAQRAIAPAVGHEHRARAAVGQRAGGQLARLAGADDRPRARPASSPSCSRASATATPERLSAPLADGGLGAHALAGGQRRPEQAVGQRPDGLPRPARARRRA